jgi:SMODS-associating 2TM, beta-strand rich effector domain
VVNYSIDADSRPKIYFYLAVIVLLVVPRLVIWLPDLAKLGALPSGFAVFGGLVYGFNKWVWRFWPVSLASGIPYIAGKYKGIVRFEETDDMGVIHVSESGVESIISQTWTRIDLHLIGDMTVSSLTTCGFFIRNADMPHFRFTYEVKERFPSPENRFGEGTGRLEIQIDNPTKLVGSFYSTKKRRGTLILSKVP